MGRVKLKIQRLESPSSRQVTFGKRRNGILKKAQEISVLCDIDILLLMFSPTGRPSVFRGQRSNIDEMIARYAQLSPKERAKRRMESLETLKRNFKKVDQDVDIEEFLDASNPSIEELHNRVMVLQDQIAQVNKRQSWWTNPDKTDNMEHLNRMENSLTDTLNRVLLLKQEKFGQKSFDSTNQSQNGMQFPIPNTTNQECNTQSWLPGGENQQMILPNEPQFLATREMDCSRDISFPSCSGLFDVVKTEDIDKSRPEENERQDDGGISIDDYTNSAYLRLPLADQFPYHSYGTLSFPDIMEPPRELNFQQNPMDYQINSNFEIQRSVYNNLQHSLVPSAGSCAISIFNQNSYPQPPNQFNA